LFDNMEDERKLFVSRLPDDIQDDEMNMIFNTYGNVVEVHILPGQKGPENLRSAFVLYDAADGAKAAIQVLDGIYKFRVDASEPIRVSIAKPRGSAKGKDAGKGKEKGGWDDGYGKGGKGNFGGYNGFPPRGGGYADRGYDDRGGYDRGYEKGEWGASRGYDRSQYADRGYDRGPEKGGYDRGYDQGYDRGGYAQPARASPYEKGCGGKSPPLGTVDEVMIANSAAPMARLQNGASTAPSYTLGTCQVTSHVMLSSPFSLRMAIWRMFT
jgi:hypothetical protein